MNFELALKLKNAGFPQDTGEYSLYVNDKNTQFAYWNIGADPEDKIAYLPTLSELIEACGKMNHIYPNECFYLMEFIEDPRGDGIETIWHAGFRGNKNFKEVIGSTPEEAVANLYLALHE